MSYSSEHTINTILINGFIQVNWNFPIVEHLLFLRIFYWIEQKLKWIFGKVE